MIIRRHSIQTHDQANELQQPCAQPTYVRPSPYLPLYTCSRAHRVAREVSAALHRRGVLRAMSWHRGCDSEHAPAPPSRSVQQIQEQSNTRDLDARTIRGSATQDSQDTRALHTHSLCACVARTRVGRGSAESAIVPRPRRDSRECALTI